MRSSGNDACPNLMYDIVQAMGTPIVALLSRNYVPHRHLPKKFIVLSDRPFYSPFILRRWGSSASINAKSSIVSMHFILLAKQLTRILLGFPLRDPNNWWICSSSKICRLHMLTLFKHSKHRCFVLTNGTLHCAGKLEDFSMTSEWVCPLHISHSTFFTYYVNSLCSHYSLLNSQVIRAWSGIQWVGKSTYGLIHFVIDRF